MLSWAIITLCYLLQFFYVLGKQIGESPVKKSRKTKKAEIESPDITEVDEISEDTGEFVSGHSITCAFYNISATTFQMLT